MMRRAMLIAWMYLLTINVWTGGPLLAVWVGSRVQGGGPPSMTAVFVVAATLAAVSVGLVKLLAVAGRRYDELAGRHPTVRAHAPWLRSMRGERPHMERGDTRPGGLELALVVSVVLAVIAFEVWFFFFAGSSIGHA